MSTPVPHLLYVEDDESLSYVTRDNLEREGFQVTHIMDGREALEIIQSGQKFDLYILDVMLPEVDGFDLAREIRKRDQEVPIIFLSAKTMREDRLAGLKIGADDYMIKPFSIEELILKVHVFLRRSGFGEPNRIAGRVAIGKYWFDYANLLLAYENEEGETLTQKEADLLKLLNDHRNQLVKRSFILETIWGKNDYFLGRSLDVFISRLRKYLRRDERIKIENVHGVGFKFRVET
ncbi:MAG: response regulator transcription factor [Saprospiraceae bacterium]|nr:response regulator transcription factor [Saprospiraceae bacterium]MDW8482727.1 response regulator transcription factor [Saprospiraceae bacterium]